MPYLNKEIELAIALNTAKNGQYQEDLSKDQQY